MEIQKRIGFFLGPASFMSLLLFDFGLDDLAAKVLAVFAWMIIWWVVEVVPIYITAMLPMVFFPALGIMDVSETFQPYASPIVFLFLGGFLIALAMEERGLHKRLAFNLIRITGTKPRGIILGFMLATASVAMWISNTATAVMMLPIGLSVISIIEAEEDSNRKPGRFALLILLGIAYSANIGGIMTLIGTPPNLVFAGYYFESFGMEYSFLDWMMIGVPTGLILLVICYFMLVGVIYPISNKPIDGVEALFIKKRKELGVINKAEKAVMLVFTLTVLMWVLLDPINTFFGFKMLSNTSVAMAGGLLMFLVPVNFRKGEFILHWESTKKLPWGIIILFGGGLALASGLQKAGLIDQAAGWASSSFGEDPILICIGLTLFAIFLTEIMSNVALVSVLLPVVFGIAEVTEVNPLLLTIPVTLAASCAFMMPISTPPNAIVYASGKIQVRQMLKSGIWMNLISVVVLVIMALIFLS